MSREEVGQELLEAIRSSKRQQILLSPTEEAEHLAIFYKALLKNGIDKSLAREILIVYSAK